MRQIEDWLGTLGLSEYAQKFADNAVDLSVLRDLTEQDLRDLGVLLGHRRKMMRAIAELNGGVQASYDAPAILPGGAERRHLTVMIGDLVGSTALSSRLDPEDLSAVMDAYHGVCARIVLAHDGFIADFRGDGILAYFGYPRAHEDDAERTVRAALDIAEAVQRLATPAPEPLAVRIGIASGLVLVGDSNLAGTLWHNGVVGDTPNLAARLQALAKPGSVVISTSTRRLLGDLFRLRNMGRRKVKGFTEPVGAWLVEGLSDSESRFEAVRETQLTDLIGREQEINFLLERQQLAANGDGQIVLISGEPGIGKSRLAAAFADRIADMPHTRMRYQCSPNHISSALHPVILQLQRAASFKADDTPELRLEKLEQVLAIDPSTFPKIVPLFAQLLSVPIGTRYPPVHLSPTQQRRQTLAGLLDEFEALARQRPLTVLFEDVHWADATTLELLDLTVERIRQLPVIGIFTFRPEFEPPWAGLPHVNMLQLGRLDREAVETMVTQVTGGRMLPAEVMRQIVEKTDGNPLFVEELTKAVLESGILVGDTDAYSLAGPLPPLAIPDTLQASLMSRLDGLAAVKEIGQIGAVIGRDFSFSLLSAVVGRDSAALSDSLAQLENAELLIRHGRPPEAVYTFKHALVRDAAYESLLKSRRHQLHAQIAHVLEEKFGEVAAGQPEIVAHHFTEAGLADRAVRYWLQAGQQAVRRSANAEALNHLRRGLELVPLIQDEALRKQLETQLQTTLGNALRATRGWSIDGVKEAYTRAFELGKESGLDEHTLPAAFGLWTWNFVRTELGEAQAIADLLLESAMRACDPVLQVLAHEALGFTLFAHGGLLAAHAHLEQSIALCEDDKEAAYLQLSAQDPRVHVRLYDGMTLWLLGYPDRGLALCEEARRYADRSRHPFTQAMARTIGLRIHQLRGDPATVARDATAAVELCETHDFGHYLAMALLLRGWAMAQQGGFEAGISEMRNGLAMGRGTGARLYDSYSLALLAESCIRNERCDLALDFLHQARAMIAEKLSGRFYEAEIHRLLGTVALKSGTSAEEAEWHFRNGLDVARQQQAKSLELRLAMSLHDLGMACGDRNRYRGDLEAIAGWFSEGHDTADLTQARSLLSAA